MRRLLALLLAAFTTSACRAAEAPPSFPSQNGPVSVTTVAQGLENPWALAFLPDGRMLVTERPGRMRLVTTEGRIGPALGGLPAVAARGQGGLLDVVLAPDFEKSQRIYFSYSEPRGGDSNGTAVATARLGSDGRALEGVKVIFRQLPAVDSNNHFGSRLAFAPDGNLFVTLGERYSERDQAQTLDNHLGKVVRITADGGVPEGNPFTNTQGAKPELWSYGHRNAQGAAIHPQTGTLWLHEHGPKGGDEVNIARAARNYGWPVITHGREYSGFKVGEGLTAKAGMEQPLHVWVPSIAPSGMAFYTASRFAPWRGNLFVGSLKFGQLVRLTLDGEKVVAEERLLDGLKRRIRDVRQGPDGALYLLTDEAEGAILRVVLL